MPDSSARDEVTACVIVIGNEILSGRTQDANLAYLGQGLNEIGIRLVEARVIPDVEATIVDTVNAARAAHDYVFTTGGIGPTHDDITAAAVAKAFGVALIRHPDALALLEEQYRNSTLELNEARRKMADVPEGATLIENPVSAAPGFRMENVFVLAGVPAICQAMFDGIKGGLTGGPPVLSRTITSAVPEGTLAADLGAVQADYPEVDIGSYPYYRSGAYGVSVVLRATDEPRLDAAADAVRDLIRSHGAEPRDGELHA